MSIYSKVCSIRKQLNVWTYCIPSLPSFFFFMHSLMCYLHAYAHSLFDDIVLPLITATLFNNYDPRWCASEQR